MKFLMKELSETNIYKVFNKKLSEEEKVRLGSSHLMEKLESCKGESFKVFVLIRIHENH